MIDARRALGRWSALVGVTALAVWGVAGAQATVVDRGTFGGSETAVPDNICGIALLRDSTFSGSFRVRVDRQGGQAFFQRTNITYRDVFTNPANGSSLTIGSRRLLSEVKATQVEGNVYAFTTIEAGQPFVVRDGDGNLVLRDRGVIRQRVLFDTLGDGEVGGVQLDDELIGIGGPHPGFDQSEEDFCATVEDLIG